MNKILDYIPWIGMGLLQFNSIPAIISAVENGTSTPIATVILTLAGLSCYMLRAVIDRSKLYITSNIIGITGNGILLACIL
jgi:hypothetical protein